ncbi:unnamed protein product [Pieris macdunnoughi]|uniref:Uncharacterized protein n=1 Tax=Pieris macdunnoughi TaxID=345717 RepID=A0A821SBF4_9NEOP|nr:unnamed protein product [Pieris macdunnoughi]
MYEYSCQNNSDKLRLLPSGTAFLITTLPDNSLINGNAKQHLPSGLNFSKIACIHTMLNQSMITLKCGKVKIDDMRHIKEQTGGDVHHDQNLHQHGRQAAVS